jgi:hypothetical protein
MIAAASRKLDTAAALRDRSKHCAYTGHMHFGHTFVRASVETHGHLGKLIIGYISTLSDIASRGLLWCGACLLLCLFSSESVFISLVAFRSLSSFPFIVDTRVSLLRLYCLL